MPQGIAILKAESPAGFYSGSKLYQLFPSLGQFEGVDDHVVAAYTPAAVDHGLAETTLFKVAADGTASHYGGLYSAEALTERERVIGRLDVESALANLAGGYLVVDEKDVSALKEKALALAQNFGLGHLALDPVDAFSYAQDNWGMFAAGYLVESGRADPPVRALNNVFPLPASEQEEDDDCYMLPF